MDTIVKILIFIGFIIMVKKFILPSNENESYRKKRKRRVLEKEKDEYKIKIIYKSKEEIQEEIYRKEKIKQKLEKKREKQINIYKKTKEEKPINIYNTIKPEKTKKEIFEENRKERYRKHLKETKIKGENYEIFIGEYFKKQGYKITQNGIIKGKKDNTIDVIAEKENEVIFIQCKDWKYNKKWLINHEKIKSFVGDVYTYIEKNPIYKNYNIQRKFIASNDIFNRSAKRYCKENRNIVEYKIIPMI